MKKLVIILTIVLSLFTGCTKKEFSFKDYCKKAGFEIQNDDRCVVVNNEEDIKYYFENATAVFLIGKLEETAVNNLLKALDEAEGIRVYYPPKITESYKQEMMAACGVRQFDEFNLIFVKKGEVAEIENMAESEVIRKDLQLIIVDQNPGCSTGC